MKLKELTMDILKHGYLGLSVEFSNYIDDDGKEVELLTIGEYEEPRTVWTTTFIMVNGDKFVSTVTRMNGSLQDHSELEYSTLKWVIKGQRVIIYDENTKEQPEEWYEFELNQTSDIIIA